MSATVALNTAQLSDLTKIVPGTTPNFWFQRSRFDAIPGQFRVGRRVYVDLDVFIPALKEGKVDVLKLSA